MTLKEEPAAAPSAAFLDQTAEPPVAAPAEPAAAHVDYDLRPLRVRCLEHYLERPDEERFHVR